MEVSTAEGLRSIIGKTTPGTCRTLQLHYHAEGREDTRLRALLFRGSRAGKFLWVQGGLHGDEYDGPLALSALEQELSPEKISGTLLILPIVNPSAFEGQSNASPVDHVNMNRVFGVQMPDSYSVRFGAWLLNLVEEADAFVDLHGGGQYMEVCSFATIVQAGMEADTESLAMAERCGSDYIHEKSYQDNGMLIAELARRNIPSVLVEHGGGLETAEEAVESHRKAVLRILENMHMYPDCPEQGNKGTMVQHGADLYFQSGGLLLGHAQTGVSVRKGETLIRWQDPDSGMISELTAPVSGILLAVHSSALVRKGQYAAMIGFIKDESSNSYK